MHLTQAQGLSNIRYKVFYTNADTLKLDSLSIIPGSVAVRGAVGSDVIDSSSYILKPFESKLIWLKKPAFDSVKVFFRVYPFALGGETYHKSYKAYVKASENAFAHPFIYNPLESDGKLIDFGSLDYNGSFSRSVSFGNNQDVVLNSLFNLQLSGMLTKDLEITAAITDNNIPIQPDGNTQHIQEFDKIFIQLRKDQHKVIVGDFDLANNTDYFLRFARKYEGGDYVGAYKIKNVGIFKTEVAGGIARGKFARNTLAVTEGNQGPYKLTGANGETLITILANSEQVFINGAKLDRGTDRDYTIDYNLGEITFMPKRIISADLRIVVEFQYSNNDYTRSAAYLSTDLQMKKADVYFNLFSEQDSKGNNIQQTLNADKKTFLSSIGDSIQNAFYRGFDTAAYDPNRILYTMVDSNVAALNYRFDSVFVYSTNPTSKFYAVSFSYVGDGRGNYVPADNTANGRVYNWVAPMLDSVSHVFRPQGSYEPVIFLVTPKYQQMYTLGADYKINKSNKITTEVAMSNYNQNMFSTIDKKDDIGFAGRVGYQGAIVTKGDSASKKMQSVTFDLNYEFQQNRFTPIERFRAVEFNRDWNLPTTSTQQYNQHLGIANIGYVWSNLGGLTYHFKTLIQDTVYKGYETGLNGTFTRNGFNIAFTNSYLNSASSSVKTNFIRPKADFSYAPKSFKGWKIGALYDHEINLIKAAGADTLANTSYIWQNYKVYAGTVDSTKNKYGIDFTQRYEQRPMLGKNSFGKPYYSAQSVNFTGSVTTVKDHTLNYNLTYRHAVNSDSAGVSQTPEHFYLARVDYNLSALKGVIRSTTLYEIGTGRQQKTQISYQASPTNQGDYIWVDANHNGIKEINEFVLSPYKTDSSYIRLILPTPEYASVNTNQFNEVLNINPAAAWQNKTGIRKVLSKFSLFASIQISKKTFADKNKKVGNYFNPIPLKKEDSSIVATTVSSRNSLYFNRLDPKYGAQFDFNYSQGRNYLTGGFENRLAQSEDILVRWNVVKGFNTQVMYTNGVKANQSDFYSDLKYRFTYNDVNTDFSYQFQSFLRLDLKYDLSLKVNPNDSVGKQTAQVNKFTLEGRYNRLKKSTISASLAYATIKYNDKNFPNEQLQYAMLDGLQKGNNLVWNVSFSQNLGANIQLTLAYDGRMTGFTAGDKSTLKPIHNGRAELRALF